MAFRHRLGREEKARHGSQGSGFDERRDSSKSFASIPTHFDRARARGRGPTAHAAVLTRLAVGLLWLLHFLAARRARAGRRRPRAAGVSPLAASAGGSRLINLALCFPELTERERVALAKRHFAALGRSVVERGILFWSSGERIARLVRLVGSRALRRRQQAGRAVRAALRRARRRRDAARRWRATAVSIYSRQKNAYVNRLLQRYRTRFQPITLLSRQDGIRGAIREMQRGPAVLLPARPGLRPARLGVRAVLRRAGGDDHRARAGRAARRCGRRAGGDADAARRPGLRGAVLPGVGEFPDRGCRSRTRAA